METMGDQHANGRSIHSPGKGSSDRAHSILRVDDMLQSRRQARGGRLCTPERFVGSGMREFVIAPAILLLRVFCAVRTATAIRSKIISQISSSAAAL